MQGRRVLVIRTGESVSNLAGTLAGWTDTKLSEYGKKQAYLLYEGLHQFLPHFTGVFCSDLSRAKDSLRMATLYTLHFSEDERLREIYFGDHEGEHFDTLPEEIRKDINSMDYQAPNGENWRMVSKRAQNFFTEKCAADGLYLCFTHGGLICSLTHPLGLTDVLSNGSAAGIHLEPHEIKLLFTWKCPDILNK